MGAVYDVTLKMSYDNEQDIIDLTKDYVGRSAGYVSFSDVDYSNFKSTLGIILPARGLHIDYQTADRLKCSCGFDASYGWGNVIGDWFEAIAPVLKDGSTINIYTWDYGEDIGVVRGGSVDWIDPEESDDEDDDEKGLTASDFVDQLEDDYPEMSLLKEQEGTGDWSGMIIMTFDMGGAELDNQLIDFLEENTVTWGVNKSGKLMVYCIED